MNTERILKNPEPDYFSLFKKEVERVRQIPGFDDLRYCTSARVSPATNRLYNSIKVDNNIISLYGGGDSIDEMWQDITDKLKLIK